MSTPTPAYPAATLAKLFHLSERRIQQLAKAGIIPPSQQGNYPLISSVQGYVRYLQERAAGRPDTDTSDLKKERQRLMKAQADHAEWEYQVRRGAFIAVSTVGEVLNEVAVLYASSIDALPGRLAHELVNLADPAQIKSQIFDECRHIRNLTAERLSQFTHPVAPDPAVCHDRADTTPENTG